MPFGTDSEGVSVRFNFSISTECRNEIRKNIKLSRTFNGISDFLSAALRQFCLKFLNQAHEQMMNQIQEYGKTAKTIDNLNESFRKLGLKMLDAYKQKYGSKLDAQVTVRIGQSFYYTLLTTAGYLSIGAQDLARIALYDYLKKFPSELGESYNFEYYYDRLFQEVNGQLDEGEVRDDAFINKFLDESDES